MKNPKPSLPHSSHPQKVPFPSFFSQIFGTYKKCGNLTRCESEIRSNPKRKEHSPNTYFSNYIIL